MPIIYTCSRWPLTHKNAFPLCISWCKSDMTGFFLKIYSRNKSFWFNQSIHFDGKVFSTDLYSYTRIDVLIILDYFLFIDMCMEKNTITISASPPSKKQIKLAYHMIIDLYSRHNNWNSKELSCSATRKKRKWNARWHGVCNSQIYT